MTAHTGPADPTVGDADGCRDRPNRLTVEVVLADQHVDPVGLVAEGLTNPEIGERLYISRRTVETHLAHIFRKLGISGRAHLAAEVTRS